MNLRFAALAAALVISSAGCSAIKPGCGDACGAACGGMPCHVTTSQRAPRPTIFGRGGCGAGVCDKLGWTQAGCGDACGCGEMCGDGCCGSGCGIFDRGGCGCGGSGCDSCLQGGLSKLLDCNSCGDQNYNFNPGPPGGQVAYPYYTTRGPRDFLMCNPPSIGPR